MCDACRLAAISPCPGVDNNGVCAVFYPEGVKAREERFGSCGYRNARTIDPTASKKAKKINPLKASKASTKG